VILYLRPDPDVFPFTPPLPAPAAPPPPALRISPGKDSIYFKKQKKAAED